MKYRSKQSFEHNTDATVLIARQPAF